MGHDLQDGVALRDAEDVRHGEGEAVEEQRAMRIEHALGIARGSGGVASGGGGVFVEFGPGDRVRSATDAISSS